MRGLLVAATLLLSCTAQAETLFKCVGKGKAISYQSQPCAPGQSVAKSMDYVPEPPPTPQQRRAMYLREQRDKAESAYLSGLAGTSRSRKSYATGTRLPAEQSNAACEAAKRSRQQVLDQIGLSRTYELLQRLDEDVRAACR